MQLHPNRERLLKLIQSYVSGQATQSEIDFLHAYYQYFERDSFADQLKEEELRLMQQEMLAETWVKINTQKEHVARRLWPLRLSPLLTAAAAVIFLIAIGSFWHFYANRTTPPTATYAVLINHGNNGATLTLSNGKKISLSGSAKGRLAVDAGVAITKTANGTLLYKTASDQSSNARAMNTLSTAQGEQYQVQLPDGTNVWLNAASVLRYPASFAGEASRNVELEGEGYFEVAKDKTHPFVVSTSHQQVQVLGTHFNISAYADDPAALTTLLEGSVKINDRLLKPDQQATQIKGQITINNVNTEAAIAWKNGLFIFDNETLESVLRKVARWYDIKVVYMPGADKHYLYGGSVSRYENINSLLDKLQAAGDMHYRIAGKVVFIDK